MSLRRNALQWYLKDEKIVYIIGHSWRKYIKIIFFTVLLLFLFFLIFYLTKKYISSDYIYILKWVLSIIWIIVYLKFIIDFLDIYLDSIVLTNRGVTMFRWDGLFSYTSENIGWDYIQTVYDEQKWFLDVILWKWDLNIKIHNWDYKFEEVPSPTKQANIISSTKDKMNLSNKEEQDSEDMDKFDILVDTLGEVIEDYLKHNKNKDEESY